MDIGNKGGSKRKNDFAPLLTGHEGNGAKQNLK